MACGGDDDAEASKSGDEAPSGTLRLGYFPNVTHAPAIIGVDEGIFAEALGQATLETETFPTGTEAIEALLTGSIDATFIGPNPAINGFATSGGEAVRIVAGTTSGGASLVVAEGIDSGDDLSGRTLATPSLGNTQDVALRAWLAEEGYEGVDAAGGGEVTIVNQENADTLTAFQNGGIQGAWVPEPWATRLVLEGGGHVLVDEADLWPGGRFVTTHLIVRTEYLEENPANVRALVSGLLEAIDQANADAAAAQTITNDGIEALTQRRLADETIQGAWAGADHIPPLLLRAGRVLGARGLNAYRYVVLPASLPSFVGGLKQGWAFAWRSLMAGELLVIIAGKPSIGVLMQNARSLSDAEGLMASMVLILIIGIVIDATVFGTLDRMIRSRWGLIDTATA